MLRGFGTSQGVHGSREDQQLSKEQISISMSNGFHVLCCGVAVVPEAWHPRASSSGQTALAALPGIEDGAWN